MTDQFLPFPSRGYALAFLMLIICRGMDVFSTWVATPNLVLEGNPIAKRLGWKWGLPLNLGLCFALALWPFPAIVISTTSLLVAARNFQSAWLMRSLGEQAYRDWHIQRIQETSVTLYLFCLFGQTLLIAAVGAAVIVFSHWQVEIIPLGIGVGIILYAVAVVFFTLLSIWRLRRRALRHAEIVQRNLALEKNAARAARNGGWAAYAQPSDE